MPFDSYCDHCGKLAQYCECWLRNKSDCWTKSSKQVAIKQTTKRLVGDLERGYSLVVRTSTHWSPNGQRPLL
jgi:hypothetical protein